MIDVKHIIDRVVAGDTNAFQPLIESHQKLVSHIVFRMVLNRHDREDICQDVFIKVYQKLASFQFESKFSTWVAKIAYHTCINYLKKKKIPLYDNGAGDEKSIEHFAAAAIPPDDFADEKDIASRLQAEINRLPLTLRTILTLYHLDEMSYAEISEIMNLPEGTVKSYLFRARRCLKERLTSKYQLEELWQ